MSKSKGNVIYADDLVNPFGVDAVRYYLLSAMPYAQDGSITYETFIAKYNSDLANTIGNLVNRTVSMANKYFGGELPAAMIENELDRDLADTALQTTEAVKGYMDQYHTADALARILTLAQRSNKYIDETMPWALAKDEAKLPRLRTVLANLIEAIRYIAVLSEPFMPDTAAAMMDQIGLPDSHMEDGEALETLAVFGSAPARKVGEAKALFARIDEKAMLEKIDKEIVQPQIAAAKAEAAAAEAPAEEEKAEGVAFLPEITIDEFAKIDLRVGKIVSCEKLKKSRKLLKLMVDDGQGTRQILSGISKWYKPEDLEGRKVIFVANLAPAKLAGELSEGMVLAADAGEDDVRVMFVDDSIPAGSCIH